MPAGVLIFSGMPGGGLGYPPYVRKFFGKEIMRGLIIRSQSGFYTVETENGQEVVCQLRGRLKKGRREGDVVPADFRDGSGSMRRLNP